MRVLALVLLLAGPFPLHVNALELSQCDRVTHVSHGGEDMHRDLGEGRVMWRDWWSQEGTATDYIIQDCQPGDELKFRTAEENMGDRPPFDRTEAALKVVDRHQRGARVFATLQRMADDLTGIAREVSVEVSGVESCACAALYSDLRGSKVGFRLAE
ncbi:MAG: hypothetical protein AAF641_05600 [Pseudomonadota bacterium]